MVEQFDRNGVPLTAGVLVRHGQGKRLGRVNTVLESTVWVEGHPYTGDSVNRIEEIEAVGARAEEVAQHV